MTEGSFEAFEREMREEEARMAQQAQQAEQAGPALPHEAEFRAYSPGLRLNILFRIKAPDVKGLIGAVSTIESRLDETGWKAAYGYGQPDLGDVAANIDPEWVKRYQKGLIGRDGDPGVERVPCPLHPGAALSRREAHGEYWYTHKHSDAPGGWCRPAG